MDKFLLAIPDLCTGCNRCVYVCSAVKEGVFIPSKARIQISNFSLKGYSVPNVCFQCPNPDCLPACPTGAIHRNDQEVVRIDEKKCNGCGDCLTACPYGMIQQDAQGLAYKCDYCGADPACVKECYPKALLFQVPDKELRRLRSLQMKQRVKFGSPAKKRHRVGRNILAGAR